MPPGPLSRRCRCPTTPSRTCSCLGTRQPREPLASVPSAASRTARTETDKVCTRCSSISFHPPPLLFALPFSSLAGRCSRPCARSMPQSSCSPKHTLTIRPHILPKGCLPSVPASTRITVTARHCPHISHPCPVPHPPPSPKTLASPPTNPHLTPPLQAPRGPGRADTPATNPSALMTAHWYEKPTSLDIIGQMQACTAADLLPCCLHTCS